MENQNEQKAKRVTKKKNPLATYIFVVLLLTALFALLLPAQFGQLIDAIYATFAQLSQLGQVLVVLVVIVLVIYLLRRRGEV